MLHLRLVVCGWGANPRHKRLLLGCAYPTRIAVLWLGRVHRLWLSFFPTDVSSRIIGILFFIQVTSRDIHRINCPVCFVLVFHLFLRWFLDRNIWWQRCSYTIESSVGLRFHLRLRWSSMLRLEKWVSRCKGDNWSCSTATGLSKSGEQLAFI